MPTNSQTNGFTQFTRTGSLVIFSRKPVNKGLANWQAVSLNAIYMALSINSDNCVLDNAPTFVPATSPLLKRIRVGMPLIPYFGAVLGLASTSILQTFSFYAYSLAISSRTGAIIIQGPHHSAQKSTKTGPSASNTSLSKLLSEV